MSSNFNPALFGTLDLFDLSQNLALPEAVTGWNILSLVTGGENMEWETENNKFMRDDTTQHADKMEHVLRDVYHLSQDNNKPGKERSNRSLRRIVLLIEQLPTNKGR